MQQDQCSLVNLIKTVVSFPSTSYNDCGLIDFFLSFLLKNGFECHELNFGNDQISVRNIYAEFGNGSKTLCFAGHLDVVPPGNLSHWRFPPFEPTVCDGLLYGRGVVDMKSAICAFIISLIEAKDKIDFTSNKISILITSDEEGENFRYGTQSVVNWLKENNKNISFCIVGEPTSSKVLGDEIKNGRRGSLNFNLKCFGVQGHVAYPNLALNPIKNILNILHKMINYKFDDGNKYFSQTKLEITSIDVGNKVLNIIPNAAEAKFNIRYNNLHTCDSIYSILINICNDITSDYTLDMVISGEPFITEYNESVGILCKAIKKNTGCDPILSTSGGTSDARFIKDISQVVEFGLCNYTAHKVDESASLSDIRTLKSIYHDFILGFFNVEKTL